MQHAYDQRMSELEDDQVAEMKENIIINSRRPIRNVITSRRGVEGAVYQADLNERRAMSNVSMEIH